MHLHSSDLDKNLDEHVAGSPHIIHLSSIAFPVVLTILSPQHL
jgi:hypothetical protein